MNEALHSNPSTRDERVELGRLRVDLDASHDNEMLYGEANPEESSFDYQRQFAMSLVDSLGLDASLQACRDNAWYGTLDILLTEPATVWY